MKRRDLLNIGFMCVVGATVMPISGCQSHEDMVFDRYKIDVVRDPLTNEITEIVAYGYDACKVETVIEHIPEVSDMFPLMMSCGQNCTTTLYIPFDTPAHDNTYQCLRLRADFQTNHAQNFNQDVSELGLTNEQLRELVRTAPGYIPEVRPSKRNETSFKIEQPGL